MKSIILQFVTTENDMGSWLIRHYQDTQYSHVDAVLEDGTLLGARLDGVKIRPPDYEKFDKLLRVELDTTEEVAEKYYASLKSQLGKPYDKEAIMAFATFGIGPKQIRDWKNPVDWFCSELSTWGLLPENSGFLGKDILIPLVSVTPRDEILLISPFVSRILQQIG